jgi:iron complex outermembrane receptor protein
MIIPAPSLAQEGEIEDFAELDLEELLDVVFAASKHKQSIIWSPSAITVFTREDIQSSGASNLTDLLRRVPGFDVYELKPSYPLVGARALTDDSNNLVLMIVDGREDLVELSGFPLWASLTFDMSEIERVEVIRGPGSTLYGANAFSAVVNVTTVSGPSKGDADVILSGGDEGQHRLFGRYRDGFSLGGGTLDFGAGLGASARRSASDRYCNMIKTDFRTNGFIRYSRGEQFNLSVHGGIMEGTGNIFMHAGELRAEHVLNHWVMGKGEAALGERFRLKAQLYHSRYYGEFQSRMSLDAFGVWLANPPSMNLDTNSIDGQVQIDFKVSDSLMLMAGGNLRYTTLEAAKLILTDDDELRGAGFIHVQWSALEVLQLTGGLRLDLNTDTTAALSPRAVAVYRPWPQQAFRLGYALAFRKPSFFESRVHIRIEDAAFPEIVETFREKFGNENLVNETVHSVEAGWRAHLLNDRLLLSVDLFYNLYLDTIYFDVEIPTRLGLPDVARADLMYKNTTDTISALGGEAEVVWRPMERASFWGNLSMRLATNHDTGERMPSEPLLRANLGGRYRWESGLLLDLAIHYVSEYEFPLVDPENSLSPHELVPLGNEFLLVGRLGYRFSLPGMESLEAGLTVRAPLGRPFREYTGVPMRQPGKGGSLSDFGGEMLVRLVSFYLRASF